jgi:hypothetical protein
LFRSNEKCKGGRLVGSNDNTDDANEKSTGISVPVLIMCGNIGNGHAADHGNGTFDCRFGSKFKADSKRGNHSIIMQQSNKAGNKMKE